MADDIVLCQNLEEALSQPEIAMLFRSDQEVTSLKTSVESVKGALIALGVGENMEETDATRSRIRNLVALLHQADDMFDVARTYPNRRRTSRRALQKICQEIEQLAVKLSHRFGSNSISDRPFEPPVSFRLAENIVLGRDEDKQKIIHMLLKPKGKSQNEISVIPIVGLEGSGKSALAQLVYDDEKVKNHFDLRMWVCVSHVLDERQIIREIADTCTSRMSNHSGSFRTAKHAHSKSRQNELSFLDLLGCRSFGRSTITPNNFTRVSGRKMDIFERRLRKEIDGKLFLLILDDACLKHWLCLKKLLAAGEKGSHVLVTTSSVEVANLAKTENTDAYQLKGLPLEDSWKLLETLALGEVDESDHELEELGKSIVEICEGIPLTIRVAGSLLYGKEKDKWIALKYDLMVCRENDQDVMSHIIRLSYFDLPTCLKACFGYCSLFPEDFDFNKQDLICLWIAQGFVHPLPDRSLEQTAEMYFLELSRRCFFQDVMSDDLGNAVACKMHSVIHNLACQTAAEVVNMDTVHNVDSGVCNVLGPTCKHVSFDSNRDLSIKIPSSLLQAERLRTLVSVKESDCDAEVRSVVPYHKLITHFKYLRVLDLQDLGIEALPCSIGKLIHLRYLDLSKNDFLVTLPMSVTKLYNLQTLKLNSCPKLTGLPSNFGELVNLKHLEVDECDSLIGMPRGLESLTELEILNRFIAGNDGSNNLPTIGLKALKAMDKLRGRLTIDLMGNWMTSIHEGLEAKLREKSHLTELKINWRQPVCSDVAKSCCLLSKEEKLSYLKLLDHLQPNANLKILCIEGYKGDDFPGWARLDRLATLLPNLVVISIEGCDKCEHLPPFGELQSLKRLTLRHMAKVKYVEAETYLEMSTSSGEAASSKPFQSLEELTLHNFYELEGWWKEVILTPRHRDCIQYFPRLSKLSIWNCPKLTSMPLFSRVVTLDLRNVNQKLLEECAKKASNGIRLQPMNEALTEKLQIKRCPDLESFEAVRKGLGGLPALKHLVIERCDALASLASELCHLTSLEQLEISSCKKLDLSDDRISNSGKSNSKSWLSLITISNPWKSLKNLRHMTLREMPKMVSLPSGMKHLQSLKFLWLSSCTALTSLPAWISSLIVLQHLRIENCPALTSLPDGIREVKSLKKVEITECLELMERCKEHTGEDRHKIEHARILLHKSWRYGVGPELGATKSRSNIRMLDDVKYLIVPVIAAGK